MSQPILIGCAHGTRSAAGQAEIRRLLAKLDSSLTAEVREAYVDVQSPELDAVVEAIPRCDDLQAVVVPLLLGAGYHVRVDIARATAGRDDIRVAPALGPDRRLIDILCDRLDEAGAGDAHAVVLASAGSSDENAQQATRQVAQLLAERRGSQVQVAHAAGIHPRVDDVVAGLRRADPHRPVAVASYLLAPGFFQRRLHQSGADLVTGALLPHPALTELVRERYTTTVQAR